MFTIAKEFIDEILNEARTASNREICGVLGGKDGRVERVYKMKNTAKNPECCYFMDSIEQLRVMKEIRNSGLEMIGIYHSHPESSAYPSARDVELAFYPEAVYVIVSLKNKELPEVRAFRIVEGKIEEEKIQ